MSHLTEFGREGVLWLLVGGWVGRVGVVGQGADVLLCIRPVANPTCQSLWPWEMAGSRPAHGGRGVCPVAVELSLRGFIGVIVVLFVVDV